MVTGTPDAVPVGLTTGHDDKRRAIHAAAISEFSSHGIRATSMAKIAEAAGMSRPALYQYFENKTDIFASAFVAAFEEHVDAALAVLTAPDKPLAEQLDGFLQRYEGDLWERLAASPHRDEIAEAKTSEIATAIADVIMPLHQGLERHLLGVVGEDRRTSVAMWCDTFRLAPAGLRADQPSVDTYRQRLHSLSRGVAADIQRG